MSNLINSIQTFVTNRESPCANNGDKWILRIKNENGTESLEAIKKSQLSWWGRFVTWLGYGPAAYSKVLEVLKRTDIQTQISTALSDRTITSELVTKLHKTIQKGVDAYNQRHRNQLTNPIPESYVEHGTTTTISTTPQNQNEINPANPTQPVQDQPRLNGHHRIEDNQGILEGTFVNGKLHGHGIMITPSNHRYEGLFDQGRLHGQITETLPDGTIRNSTYDYGSILEGIGTKSFPQIGVMMSGEFREGYLNGQGKIQDKGATLEGTFKNNLLNGEGTIIYKRQAIQTTTADQSSTYVCEGPWIACSGTFLNGQLHGPGEMGMFQGKDRIIIKGLFEKFIPVGKFQLINQETGIKDEAFMVTTSTSGKIWWDLAYIPLNGPGVRTYPDGNVEHGYYDWGAFYPEQVMV